MYKALAQCVLPAGILGGTTFSPSTWAVPSMPGFASLWTPWRRRGGEEERKGEQEGQRLREERERRGGERRAQ